MADMKTLKFTKTHEWVRQDSGNKITVGITDYAQKEIRDIVYIELPKIGKEISQGQAVVTIESVKAAFEIYAPVTGKVIEVNDKAAQDVTLVHKEPYDAGWLFKMETTNTQEIASLMDCEVYEKTIKEGASH